MQIWCTVPKRKVSFASLLVCVLRVVKKAQGSNDADITGGIVGYNKSQKFEVSVQIKFNKNFAVAKKTSTDGHKFSNARPTELIIHSFQRPLVQPEKNSMAHRC
jgi:hypothetical protein